MKKIKLFLASVAVIAMSMLIPNKIKADGGCVICTTKDGRCTGSSTLACVDEKNWWESWDCKTSIMSVSECPPDPE